jgi:hypothetical protein
MEPWMAADAHIGGVKAQNGAQCRPVKANSRHLDEE